ncbi:hypothetical protein EDB92DRAFT_1343429 [Lactarius akahatsu]|uniref:Uncharacterized protein n=1 Tax=Lactarius akahatsu TaxID=416441 RepID=A0AAD4LEQ6_9AGAM|nr:hypothetical protein EDB92DRAFT_1343429 [Lactarius akahatsu]
MPSVAATLRQYPSHSTATIKYTVNGSPSCPILNVDHTTHSPRRRPSLPAHQRALISGSFKLLHYSSEVMRTPTQIRRHCVTALSGRHRDRSSQIPVPQGTSTSTTPRHALPRKIAQGVFFVDPTSGDRDAALSTRTLVDLEITHAVVARGSDLRLSSGMQALFVGSHDPLSRVVAWMRAVRRLGACVIVSDVAAAAGYLVVELSLTPRSAWLRIARGIPPAGDLVLAKLCALALTHSEKDEVSRSDRASDSESAGGHGGSERRVAPRSCRSLRGGTRGESGLKHVLISSL